MNVSKNALLDFFRVHIGDEVVVTRDYDKEALHYIVNEDGLLQSIISEHIVFELTVLVGCDYEVIRPKKIGNKMCGKIKQCRDCPLYRLDCTSIPFGTDHDKTLYEMLYKFKEIGLDPDVCDVLEKKLDKEVIDERVSKDS